MNKKRTLTYLFFALVIIAVVSNGQTSQDPCPSGTPKCYSDLAPYAGHNLSASQLPPNLCPEGCAGDNRRVIVIRIDSSWGTTTNSNIWNAVQCAASAWNNAKDDASPPNKIGYYFAVDQSNLTNVAEADITVVKEEPPDGSLGSCNVGFENENPNRQNVVRLDPKNGDLGVGAGLNFNASDLCGRVAHELGHLIGVSEAPSCRSIMFGVNANGSRDVDTVQPNDVSQVNKNFNAQTRSSCQATAPQNGTAPEPTVSSSPTPITCVDNDHDGVCAASDCNDNNFSASYDWDSDGFCEDVDCNDFDASTYPGAQIATEPVHGQDRNCNGEDDWHEVYCGIQAEMNCRAAGRDWDGGRCTCGFFSDPSPVLIDVLGNGFRLTSSSDGVVFDLNNDGVKEQLSWTSPSSDDAWLAFDRNGNGFIDQGSELFGNFTVQPSPPAGEERNGFLALAEYDKASNGGNGDGVLTPADAIFASLRLWQDLNHNGVSEPSELFGLETLNVRAIELSYKSSKKTDEYGNQFKYRAKVEDAEGAQVGRWAWDVFLVRSP